MDLLDLFPIDFDAGFPGFELVEFTIGNDDRFKFRVSWAKVGAVASIGVSVMTDANTTDCVAVPRFIFNPKPGQSSCV